MRPARIPFLKSTAVAAALAVAGSAIAIAPALAQPGAQASAAQEVTVVAPKVARHHYIGGARFAGAPIEVVSLTRTVSFADLDLTKQADVATFQARVQTTAQAACGDLEARYPSTYYVPVPADQSCVQTASDQAMALAKEVIAAANGAIR